MLRRWVEREQVPAVHRRDLEMVLDEIGLKEKIVAGKLRCAGCDKPVTLEKIQCLYMEDNEIRVCCDNIECYREVVVRGKERAEGEGVGV